MALLHNNLIINKNSERFTPFLINLLSGRRRLLKDDEFQLIKSMALKQDLADYTEDELILFGNLKAEKQLLEENERIMIEEKMNDIGYFHTNTDIPDEIEFSIHLTWKCNMSCSYCIAGSYVGNDLTITSEHVDSIYNFYLNFMSEAELQAKVKSIGISGGEPLLNSETVGALNYINKKWPNAKLGILTNGVNLLKFYQHLPLRNIEEVHVSLDGLKETHLDR